jgi:hypothetical protein
MHIKLDRHLWPLLNTESRDVGTQKVEHHLQIFTSGLQLHAQIEAQNFFLECFFNRSLPYISMKKLMFSYC